MVTKLMLRNYNACKVYIDDNEKNRKTVAAVEKFLTYCDRWDPVMRIAATEKYFRGRPWKDIAHEIDRSEDSIRRAFDRFLQKYNNMH